MIVAKIERIARTLLGKRFVRFLLVGGLNTLFGYGTFAFMIFIGLHYALAAALSTVAGIIFNFFATGSLVFKNANPVLFFRFLAVYGALYPVGVAELRVGLLLGSNHYLTAAVCLLPNALLTYSLQKRWVFRSPKRVGS